MASLTLVSSMPGIQSHPRGRMMKLRVRVLLVFVVNSLLAASVHAQEAETVWDEAIGGVDTVFLEEMTAGEIAAAMRDGSTSVIVATGGLEQNGPNVATGKHNYVLRVTADAIARKHGKMLVSSIVQFVPEGEINPPTGHMNFPGTISLRQDTFEALLTDICSSLRQHNFQNIFLIGDSGGNQDGMQNVAMALNSEWHGDSTRVYYIPEYYSEDMWSFDFLKQLGYTQLPDEATSLRNSIHTDLHYESIMAVVDPQLVRAQTRLRNGKYEVHGVEMKSESELIELGKKLTEYRAEITVKAMREAVAE
jgi:creatinine amidohydrolase